MLQPPSPTQSPTRDLHHLDGGNADHPSDGWLCNPAWIDGGVNPPCFYILHQDMEETRAVALQHVLVPPVPPLPPPPPQVMRPVTAQAGPIIPLAVPQTETDWGQNVPVSNMPVGHLVSATNLSTEKPISSRGKPTVKKLHTTKSDQIPIEDINRVDFVKAFLRIHELTDQYSPGVHFGPQFKLWWTGSSGGKAGASTIENDHDFSVALAALLKKTKVTSVQVEFDVEAMDGYWIRKRPLLQVDHDEDELSHGTKVPRTEAFSAESQLHGAIIMQLKRKWTCEKHQGEHGEAGYCYINPTGEHVGLNHRKLKSWAAAIAAADATKHEPPNTIDFDGLCDGCLDVAKPRGRMGPHPPIPSTSASSNTTTMLLTAVTSLVASQLATKHVTNPSLALPSTPSHCRHHDVSTPLSPTPVVGTEVDSCLQDFLAQKGINLCDAKDVLTEFGLTPDILSDVPVSRFCDLLGTVEGRALKLQAFSRVWSS
ncbi:hypothetical protein BDN67DRAFT_1016881 [Paxillus ammoniavirescens]|nr:hypothetical protein BDN67DRAFT_1016881 [Paxillus ammoniavirescens]